LTVSTITASYEAYAENSELEVHFIDVGTGDAILIRVPVDGQNKWLLIDGGYDGDGKEQILPYLQERGVEELEYVIATHYDGDHIGGFDEIFPEVTVKNLYGRGGSPFIETDHQDYKIFETYRLAVDEFVPTGEQKPANIDLGSAHFELLADGDRPVGITDQEDSEDIRSIVYLLTFNKFKILLGGDCHSECEEAILPKLSKTVLYKVHWHGKNVEGKASSQALLEKIRPEISVISEGDHSGRPHEPVLDRLRNMDSKICRTDLHGNIVFSINQNAWSIKTSKFDQSCPDVFAVDSFGKANWVFYLDNAKQIWIKIRDADKWVTDNTFVYAVLHDQRVLEAELARYGLGTEVTKNDMSFLLAVANEIVFGKFDLVVDFNGDKMINGNDFRERSPFVEGKANEAWPSFKVERRIIETEQEENEGVGSNLVLGITIGLSIVAIALAIVSIVHRRKK
jgi:beta-lactamase superfamily II metal-dependent hydrolase